MALPKDVNLNHEDEKEELIINQASSTTKCPQCSAIKMIRIVPVQNVDTIREDQLYLHHKVQK